ncbi:hypothetical protein NQ317_018851 [Molorchus minor]|uniref:ATP synthase F0 subunit 8 n=1 Tax=Molorchus minor TaxID=1323400 RepID=A0ABQ9J6W6_9CUCU|nr:hypothetical protein NQ317_018851 [Molorchus minor]
MAPWEQLMLILVTYYLLYIAEKIKKTRDITKPRAIGEMKISIYSTTRAYCISNPAGTGLIPMRLTWMLGSWSCWSLECGVCAMRNGSGTMILAQINVIQIDIETSIETEQTKYLVCNKKVRLYGKK